MRCVEHLLVIFICLFLCISILVYLHRKCKICVYLYHLRYVTIFNLITDCYTYLTEELPNVMIFICYQWLPPLGGYILGVFSYLFVFTVTFQK